MKMSYIFRTLMLFCVLNLSGAMIFGGCITGDGDAGGDDAVDTDSDDLSDEREAELGTDPNKADTDDDGLMDGKEVEIGSDPLKADTDNDGYTDF